VGTPETIADALVEWQAAGIDGVNVVYRTTPGSFAEFIDEVTPMLQKRGVRQAHSGSAYFPAGRPH
jgi:alkanesulfonate monooxygenase SsuD/methylene tetrahydromethanopterin reductase-like flavin-dependent oxidoreductase (luciferase family)